MLAIGMPLLLLGLALADEMRIGIAIAIFLGLSLAVATARLRKPANETDSPWWGLLVLVLVPVGFAGGFGDNGMAMAGVLLVITGFEFTARSLLARRTVDGRA